MRGRARDKAAMRRFMLLSVLFLAACGDDAAPLNNVAAEAEMENQAGALAAEVENSTRAVEAQMQNDIDAIADQANLVEAETNAVNAAAPANSAE